MRVREFRASDSQRCSEIFERAWNVAFPAAVRSVTEDYLERETAGERILVAEKGGRVVGFAALFEPELFLHHLYVDPEHHRQGVGTLLLEYVQQIVAADLSLKCQIANQGAMRFYKQRGFAESGECGEDGIGRWVGLTKA